MGEVTIKNPKDGKEKVVTNATLGVWRRKGWILVDESKKIDLLDLRESEQEDVTVASDNVEDQQWHA